MKSFKKLGQESAQAGKFQENVELSLKQINSKKIINGVLIQGVKLKSGSNEIPHTLNRNLLGYVVCRQRGQAQIWDSQDSNKRKGISLILNSTADVTVDLWCF